MQTTVKSTRPILVAALLALSIGALLAILPNAHAQGMARTAPEAGSAGVLAHLAAEDYRRNWKFFPGKQALYKGQVPHGMLLTTYVNDVAREALAKRADSLPHGSIIVKENYTPDRVLAAVTVMYKAKGFHPEHGDWFWMKYSPDGHIAASGKVAGCIVCHDTSGRDYVMTPLP